VSSAPQTKIKLKFEVPLKKGGSLKEVNAELYEALLVDRDNKDATIRENEVHIDELYKRIRQLETKFGDLQPEKDELTEIHKTGLQGKDSELFEKLELQNSELINLKLELEKTSSELLEVKEKCSELESTVRETRTLLASAEQEKQGLLLKVNHLKDNEEESRCRYEMDIKELDALCKKLVDDMAGVRAEEDEKKKELEEDVKKLKEEVLELSTTNSDLDSKLSQKQQMILMLQSELSSAELELEECKSENEKMVTGKAAMTEKYGSDMKEMKALIRKLEGLLSDERDMRMQELQVLEENVLNNSLVRENLETIIADKQLVLSALNDKYLALEGEFEKFCMEQKLVTEAHRLEMDDMHCKYEKELNELKGKEKEAEKVIESLTDRCHSLEAEVEKSSLEHKLMTEAHRLEMDDIYHKNDEELNKLKEKQKETEMKMVVLTDKNCALETEFETFCLEKKHVIESYMLEVDEINHKHEDELHIVREELNYKEREVERIKEVMEEYIKKVEEQAKEVRAAAEMKLEEVKDAAERRIKEFEVEAGETINDSRARVEVKLKEAELEIHVYMEKAMQAEEELRRITHHRDELRISNMENQLTIVDLQDKIDTLVTELNTAKESYEADLNHARNEHSMTKKQCKKLEIVISNIQASLEALQLRLLESERDVEQLTTNVEQVQAQKAALEEEVEMLTQKLEDSKQSMSQLETDTLQQIEEIRRNLLCKLEDFKEKANENIAAKEEEILECRHKTEELSARVCELTETLSAIEETNTEHEREIEALTEKLDHQRDCAKIATQQIATLEASNVIHQHEVQALTAELEYQKDFSQEASDHIAALGAAKSNQDKAICDLTSEVKAEREMALKLHGDTEELTMLMNYNSESGSDLVSTLKENLKHYKSEMKYVIEKLKNDIKTKEFDIDQKNTDICRKNCEIKSATERIAELVAENTRKEEKIADHNQKIEELCSEVEELKTSMQAKLDSELMLKLAEKKKHIQR
jgi:early endosome antigen 1